MMRYKRYRFIATHIGQLILVVCVIFLIKAFVFSIYHVPSGSMETTILIGDRCIANKFRYLFKEPQAGDVIVFNDPTFCYSKNGFLRFMQRNLNNLRLPSIGTWPVSWIKRIIGVPGDEIKGVIENGKAVLYRNGQKLDEPYINQYPLIGLLPISPSLPVGSARKEAEELIEQKRLDVALYCSFITHGAGSCIEWRSFDPSLAYDMQPFYPIDAQWVLTDRNNQPILKLPALANRELQLSYARQEGKNHWNGSDEFYIKLAASEYWVMGDNRQVGKDSRYIGPIDARLIQGCLTYRIFSFYNGKNDVWLIGQWIKHPIKFWNWIRWNRSMQSVA